jgi:Type I phosphodiesterase / nucleotide pyrophosphatase/Tetratricopeptide repeat
MNLQRKLSLGLIACVLASLGAWGVARALRHTARGPSPLAVPEIAERVRAGRPVIFVGLDGADWQLLDRYAAAGAMPNLARLVAEGAGGVLETIHPPLSPIVWTSIMTGVSPVEHRILDFTRFSPAGGQKEPITSDERQAPAIWNMAGYAGRTSATFGLWATYPAERVFGLLVSDRMMGFLFTEEHPPAGSVFPADREAWARATLDAVRKTTGYAALHDYLPWLSEPDYQSIETAQESDPYAHPVSALRRILIETELYHRLATDWIAKERPDLAIVYFQGTDSIGHVFAPFAPPRQAGIAEPEYARYHQVPERYFRHVDALVGDYRRLAEERGAVLMIASDHGFFWEDGRPTQSSVALATAARWHRKDGIYVLWGPGIVPAPGHPHQAGATQVCSTLLALLGLPRGLGLAEPVLPGVPAPSGKAVNYAAHYAPAPAAAVASTRSDAEAVEKLKALGYVGAGETASAPAGAVGTRTAGSYNNEGLVLRSEGKLPAAQAAFEHALEMDANLGSALWNLSDVLRQQKKDDDRSDALLVRAFAAKAPETNRFLVERAIEYQRAGDAPRSLRLLDAALAARQDEPEAWLFRGRYRVEAGDCRGALEDFRHATALAPSHAPAYASEGLAYLCLGYRAAARRSLARSLQLDPNQPRVKEFLGRL